MRASLILPSNSLPRERLGVYTFAFTLPFEGNQSLPDAGESGDEGQGGEESREHTGEAG